MTVALRPLLLAAAVLFLAAFPASAADAPKRSRPQEGALQTGDPAPDFTLALFGDTTRTVSLSAFRGKQPVFLVFGSYT
jgi:ribonuclease I